MFHISKDKKQKKALQIVNYVAKISGQVKQKKGSFKTLPMASAPHGTPTYVNLINFIYIQQLMVYQSYSM